jgi:hypothetical protein
LLDEIPYDTVGDTPLDEVELGDGRRQALKLDTCRTTERVEELFGVAVEA